MKNFARTGIYKLLMLAAIIAIAIIGIPFISKLNISPKTASEDHIATTTPQLSGWIAWWAEQKGYDLIDKYPGSIKTVSPVWFMVDENLKLYNVGEAKRDEVIAKLKKAKVKIYPTLGSEIGGKQLGPLLGNEEKVDELIATLVNQLVILNVDGLDVDLEAIEKKDKENLTRFLTNLRQELSANGLKMSVAVHAKHPEIVWEGNEGQDLAAIGVLADEVRLMLYDEHFATGDPGAISSYDWMIDVLNHTRDQVPYEKIVAGIPSYGYLWDGQNEHGLQYDDFKQAISIKNASERRDEKSGEAVFEGQGFSGWLSDSEAINSKISLLRENGINRFIIWHLGGMDESFFDKKTN